MQAKPELKEKMKVWRSNFEKHKIYNELNKIHVYDPSMVKRDL